MSIWKPYPVISKQCVTTDRTIWIIARVAIVDARICWDRLIKKLYTKMDVEICMIIIRAEAEIFRLIIA